jgi:hypothetical protein
VLWVPATLTTGDEIRVTFLMAAVQFRPWQTRGFFLRGVAGMAFLKNWLDAFENVMGSFWSLGAALVFR